MDARLYHPQNIIFREMALDICYRLELFDELFYQTSSLVLSAAAIDDFDIKVDATASLLACAQSLRVIHSDCNLLFAVQNIVFPPEFHAWLWFMPDADEITHDYLQSLRNIARKMEVVAFNALNKKEITA